MVLIVTSGIFVELFLAEGCVDGIGQKPMKRALRSNQPKVIICAVDYSSDIFYRVENDFDKVIFFLQCVNIISLVQGAVSKD